MDKQTVLDPYKGILPRRKINRCIHILSEKVFTAVETSKTEKRELTEELQFEVGSSRKVSDLKLVRER